MTTHPLFYVLAILVISIVTDTAWVALFRARPVAHLRISMDTPRRLAFVSSQGSFLVDAASALLVAEVKGRKRRIPFDQVQGLEFRTDEKWALLEELFFGMTITDWFQGYRDTTTWFAIAAVLQGGERVPLYLSGQYERREFMLGWYIDLQAAALERLGLLVDVDAQSRDLLARVQAHLGNTRLL